MISYSTRFPYPDISQPTIRLVTTFQSSAWEVPPVTAFEADTTDEVEEVHATIRDGLAGCGDWLTGNASTPQSTLPGALDPKNLTVWSDGSFFTNTTATRIHPQTTELRGDNGIVDHGVAVSTKSNPVYVRTYTHNVFGKIRAATYVIPSFHRPWVTAEALTTPHRRALVYLENMMRAVIDPGKNHKRPYHRLPILADKDRPQEGLTTPGVSNYMTNVMWLLDYLPYPLTDKVLQSDGEALYQLGQYAYPTDGLKAKAKEIAGELCQWHLLKVVDNVM